MVNVLDEENIAASLLDPLTQVEDISLLFFENLVDLSIVVDDNLIVHLRKESGRLRQRKDRSRTAITHIRFRRTELELNETNFCLLHPSGTTFARDHGLVQDDAVDQFRILDGTTNFLDNSDITKIDI